MSAKFLGCVALAVVCALPLTATETSAPPPDSPRFKVSMAELTLRHQSERRPAGYEAMVEVSLLDSGRSFSSKGSKADKFKNKNCAEDKVRHDIFFTDISEDKKTLRASISGTAFPEKGKPVVLVGVLPVDVSKGVKK